LTVNLALLGAFKYFNFFSENVNLLGSWVGLEPFSPALNVLLPVGISFYTFQTMSYTIEIYQRKIEPCSSVIEFALFVSFFPQLVAGPIVRASQFLPQLEKVPELDNHRIGSGLYQILVGLSKKILIADYLGAHFVDAVFADPGAHGALTLLLAVYAFKMQIYCDFSGYSDIAIGSARLLGFELPINFRSPFKARSVGEFWERWHISMSSWFRDFVFFPLGGSRNGKARTYLNIMVAMFLVGLWHGASWTFVMWGLTFGLCVSIERLILGPRSAHAPKDMNWLRDFGRVLLTFHIITISSVMFRAESMADVGVFYSQFFFRGGWELSVPASTLFVLALGYGTHFLPETWKTKSEEVFSLSPAFAQAFAMVLVVGSCVALHLKENPFYYFQF
jgi:D-alanyl-lipoteichoic acid acyltransferase DltB (MBOAT superfamily)